MQQHGILIAFEGIDGAGKTTQVSMLVERLKHAGIDPVSTREPWYSDWGQKIRRSAVDGRLPPGEEIEAFEKDRREHVAAVIAPGLSSQRVVVVDRYYYSTAAYQGARGFDPQEILARNEGFAPKPDAVILLDIDVTTSAGRIRDRGAARNTFEDPSGLDRARSVFESLADRPGVHQISGAPSADLVHEQVMAVLMKDALFRFSCLKPYLQSCEPEYCTHRIVKECKYPQIGFR